MLKITIEADDAGREEAEHYCLCLAHQDQVVDSFLTLLLQVANGAAVASVRTRLGEGETMLPPLVPGKCRLCKAPMPMPGNLGMCTECRDGILNEQAQAVQDGSFIPPPPGVLDPSLGGMFNPPTVGSCLSCGKPLVGSEFMFCRTCGDRARHATPKHA